MNYSNVAIPEESVPRAAAADLQHVIETYASETNKVASVWREFLDADLDWRPHPRSSSVREILRHQLLSERRFFGEFLSTPEPSADAVLPGDNITSYIARFVELARARLEFLASQTPDWWRKQVLFFDVERERIWVFWRRVLHTAHHRTQLTVYLRLMDKPVPATYGPTADVTWKGADPTNTVDSAARR